MNNQPYISTIIPTRDRPTKLKRCLDSILNQEILPQQWNYEIIVSVDKCDTQTRKWLGREASSEMIKIIYASSSGANAARNAGIKGAKGKILLFLDDDCALPHKHWLAQAYRIFQDHRKAAVFGGGYILADCKDIFTVCRNRLDNFYLEQGRFGTNRTTVLLGGACAYRKQIFQNYGYFDERLSYGSTETEMNDRLLRYGEEMYLFSELSVLHMPGRKKAFSYLRASFLQGAGQALSLIKNGGVKNLRNRKKMWPLRIIDGLSGSQYRRLHASVFLIANAFFYHTGVMLGYIWFVLNLGKGRSER